eukprot:GHVT01075864.1.p1 GENE.GHVT01075864.1~~GHVT01075864.1.p1  ORF type:complete len:987 (-),score=134.50 GHVT01075864.1:336-3296(-)
MECIDISNDEDGAPPVSGRGRAGSARFPSPRESSYPIRAGWLGVYENARDPYTDRLPSEQMARRIPPFGHSSPFVPRESPPNSSHTSLSVNVPSKGLPPPYHQPDPFQRDVIEGFPIQRTNPLAHRPVYYARPPRYTPRQTPYAHPSLSSAPQPLYSAIDSRQSRPPASVSARTNPLILHPPSIGTSGSRPVWNREENQPLRGGFRPRSALRSAGGRAGYLPGLPSASGGSSPPFPRSGLSTLLAFSPIARRLDDPALSDRSPHNATSPTNPCFTGSVGLDSAHASSKALEASHCGRLNSPAKKSSGQASVPAAEAALPKRGYQEDSARVGGDPKLPREGVEDSRDQGSHAVSALQRVSTTNVIPKQSSANKLDPTPAVWRTNSISPDTSGVRTAALDRRGVHSLPAAAKTAPSNGGHRPPSCVDNGSTLSPGVAPGSQRLQTHSPCVYARQKRGPTSLCPSPVPWIGDGIYHGFDAPVARGAAADQHTARLPVAEKASHSVSNAPFTDASFHSGVASSAYRVDPQVHSAQFQSSSSAISGFPMPERRVVDGTSSSPQILGFPRSAKATTSEATHASSKSDVPALLFLPLSPDRPNDTEGGGSSTRRRNPRRVLSPPKTQFLLSSFRWQSPGPTQTPSTLETSSPMAADSSFSSRTTGPKLQLGDTMSVFSKSSSTENGRLRCTASPAGPALPVDSIPSSARNSSQKSTSTPHSPLSPLPPEKNIWTTGGLPPLTGEGGWWREPTCVPTSAMFPVDENGGLVAHTVDDDGLEVMSQSKVSRDFPEDIGKAARMLHTSKVWERMTCSTVPCVDVATRQRVLWEAPGYKPGRSGSSNSQGKVFCFTALCLDETPIDVPVGASSPRIAHLPTMGEIQRAKGHDFIPTPEYLSHVISPDAEEQQEWLNTFGLTDSFLARLDEVATASKRCDAYGLIDVLPPKKRQRMSHDSEQTERSENAPEEECIPEEALLLAFTMPTTRISYKGKLIQ